MKAMVLNALCKLADNPKPLTWADWPEPEPSAGEILVKVLVCGVCHTELDEIEGRTPPPRLPVIPGHQVVGRVAASGPNAGRFNVGDRVGIAWIHSACGKCRFCAAGNENLCPDFQATGRDVNGGYAEFMTVPESYAHPIPDVFSDAQAAPLLCAGAVGYRSLRLTNLADGQKIGLTGFGASGHLVLKMVRHRFPQSEIFVFARNPKERAFAMGLGAVWAGDIDDESPARLDSIIDTTPVWKPVVEALRNLNPGGRLVINAIGKEAADQDYLLKLDYPTHLWMEKEIKSVANVSRQDVEAFLALAAEMEIKPDIEAYALDDANRALADLRTKKIIGAKILRVS
jgi:propanol-preferring alcohol dehydrogenase